MPDMLKKMMGVIILVLSIGGVSCSAFVSSWQGDYSGGAKEISK